jgi:cytoskeletal protein RodZ
VTKFSAPQQNQLAQIGAFLRDNREKQSKSLEDIAIRTYIRPQLLSGIETGNPEMLPEPIFVQGFIRRYGEALGLNGIELSQQFTVASIPSTPRPAPAAPPTDSPTTRLTRLNPNQPPAAQPPVQSPMSAPMFSAGNSMAAAPAEIPFVRDNSKDVAADLTLGKPATTSFDWMPEKAVVSDRPESSPVESSPIENNSAVINSSFDSAVKDVAPSNSAVEQDLNTAFEAELQSQSADSEDDFASRIAAFDQANLSQTSLNQTSLGTSGLENIAESPALNSSAALNSTQSSLQSSVQDKGVQNTSTQNTSAQNNDSFGDNLPTAFTTEAEPFKPLTNRELVGVEYDRYDQPNLKPLIIGGVIAAIAAAGLMLASLFGGDRQPKVVKDPAPTEPVAEQVVPTVPAPQPTAPAASTAPVYVEAKATAEAWVSILADGNPTPIFEGTLKPGESKVWEAQKNISVYSGDAGALTLAANGGKAAVMGERGQPQEKVFP